MHALLIKNVTHVTSLSVELDVLSGYLHSYYYTFSMLTMLGLGDVRAVTTPERVMTTICVLLFSFVCFGVLGTINSAIEHAFSLVRLVEFVPLGRGSTLGRA